LWVGSSLLSKDPFEKPFGSLGDGRSLRRSRLSAKSGRQTTVTSESWNGSANVGTMLGTDESLPQRSTSSRFGRKTRVTSEFCGSSASVSSAASASGAETESRASCSKSGGAEAAVSTPATCGASATAELDVRGWGGGRTLLGLGGDS
jgi:hypothetical protein